MRALCKIQSNLPLRSWAVALLMLATAPAAFASSGVDFDFARSIECRDVTPYKCAANKNCDRLIEVNLPISARFRGLSADDVDEINIEVIAAAGLQVADFSPATRLASDITDPIKVSTTTRKSASLDGSLGGTLPIPYAELVAHLTPTINAGTSRGTSSTETLSRLPPQRAVVVSGTAAEGRGVFFKLKRSTQTALEGRHELSITFNAPPDWDGGAVRVSCTARGQTKFLWLTQPATLGRTAAEVKLSLDRDSY